MTRKKRKPWNRYPKDSFEWVSGWTGKVKRVAEEMHHKRGYYYRKWRKAMSKAFG